MARAVVRDASPAGDRPDTFELPDLSDRITVRELIRLCVREEAARRGAHRPAAPHGPARPDPVEAAERAFRRNGFVLLVGDRQVEDLDGTVDLTGAPRSPSSGSSSWPEGEDAPGRAALPGDRRPPGVGRADAGRRVRQGVVGPSAGADPHPPNCPASSPSTRPPCSPPSDATTTGAEPTSGGAASTTSSAA